MEQSCKVMPKIVLYKGDVETTAYFLTQIGKELTCLGFLVYEFQFDVGRAKEGKAQQTEELLKFIEPDNTIVLSFNFAGVFGEDRLETPEGELFVDAYSLPYYNIVVDHPYHYHAHLAGRPKDYHQIDIDRNHIRYMKRYFPEIDVLPFMPSAGTVLGESYLPLTDRPYDVVITGSYIPPEGFFVFMDRHGKEYGDFYRSILKEVLDTPAGLLEDVVRKRLLEEIPEATEPELKETLGHIQFLDYYIRFFVRANVVRTLTDGGIKVHVFGGGWENFACERPENLLFESEEGEMITLKEAKNRGNVTSRYLTSEECLDRIGRAKISLNVMPWFKDGAHDRIFNSMLNGALCLTDDSIYLREILKDEENVCFYDLKETETLPKKVRKLLENPAHMEGIIHSAYKYAHVNHTWSNRARDFIGYLQKV